MNKQEFFLNAVRSGRLKRKSWIIRAFSIVRPKTITEQVAYDIQYILTDKDQGHHELFLCDDELNRIQLSDYQYDPNNPEPPFHLKDKIKLKKGDLPNVIEDIETTYGNIVANWLLSIYPFGDKIPFIVGKFGIKDIEKHIEKRLVSGMPDERNPEHIYMDEYNRFRKSAGLIDGLSQLCVPSATAKSMTHHPDRDKVRAELIEKYKDRLHDPAIAAKIDAALVDLDKEWLKGDDFEGFLIKGKTMKVARKKTHGIYGLEQSFGGGDFIETSLQEGWDIDKLPSMVNSLREGSFDRGAETALGGEATKFILRVMQNVTIEEEDCGSTLGADVIITDVDKNQYLGNYLIVNNTLVNLTEDNINQYLNRPFKMRSPLFCRTKRDGFCQRCIGDRYAPHETSLATAAANVGSVFMGVFMASMHGKSLSTARYDLKSELT